MKKYLLLLLLTPLMLSSCFRYGYLKRDYMEGFKDSSIRQAQFYMDRKVKIKGKFTAENNIVEDGKVTIVKTKHHDKFKIRKFTEGKVIRSERDELLVSFGNNVALTFKPEMGRRDMIYRLLMTSDAPAGKHGMIGYTKIGGHDLKITFSAKKHAFRHGKFSDKPALVLKKKVKKNHRRIHETASGSKV